MAKNNYHLRQYYNQILQDSPVLFKYQFIAEFTGLEDFRITGGEAAPVDNETVNLKYFIQTANIPGKEIAVGKTTFLGNEFRIPGIVKYSHEWSPKFLLTEDFSGYKQLEKWSNHISDFSRDGGGSKTIPYVTAQICVLDSESNEVLHKFVLEGLWIAELPKLSFKYNNGGGNMVTYQPKFKYQYVYELGADGQDPLAIT